ncbi:hypothetical protein NC652_037827 [Populus alba x Populus x berolinensis]|nr:hypothetical protein NC652_037827 [Populus alba x Populus x berolinensis]
MSKESALASAAATKAAEVGSEERSRCYLHTRKFRKWINVMHHGDKCWKDSKASDFGHQLKQVHEFRNMKRESRHVPEGQWITRLLFLNRNKNSLISLSARSLADKKANQK